MVGHLLLYHPAFVALKSCVAAGRLGRLRYIYSTRLSLGKIRREENALWSFAPHDISMILQLVGGLPERVVATGGQYLHAGVADTTLSHLAFAGDVQAHIFVSWIHPYKDQRLVVVGEKAMAVFNDVSPGAEKLLLYPHEARWDGTVPVVAKAEAEPIPYETVEPLRREVETFLAAVAGGPKPPSDAREGIAVLRVLDACQRALVSGQPVELSPWLTRPRSSIRAPSSMTASRSAPAPRSGISAISSAARSIGARCVVGQNVMIGPRVTVGPGCKIQNNVSLYEAVTLEDEVFCGPSCVFTNVLTPRAFVERKNEFLPTLGETRRHHRRQRHHRLRCHHRPLRHGRRGRRRDPRRARPRAGRPAFRRAAAAGSAAPAKSSMTISSARAPASATAWPIPASSRSTSAEPERKSHRAHDPVHRSEGAIRADQGPGRREYPPRARSRPVHHGPRGRRVREAPGRLRRRQALPDGIERHRRAAACRSWRSASDRATPSSSRPSPSPRRSRS